MVARNVTAVGEALQIPLMRSAGAVSTVFLLGQSLLTFSNILPRNCAQASSHIKTIVGILTQIMLGLAATVLQMLDRELALRIDHSRLVPGVPASR